MLCLTCVNLIDIIQKQISSDSISNDQGQTQPTANQEPTSNQEEPNPTANQEEPNPTANQEEPDPTPNQEEPDPTANQEEPDPTPNQEEPEPTANQEEPDLTANQEDCIHPENSDAPGMIVAGNYCYRVLYALIWNKIKCNNNYYVNQNLYLI